MFYFHILVFCLILYPVKSGCTVVVGVLLSMSQCQLGFNEQAVIAHACHGHTLQLSTGLSV